MNLSSLLHAVIPRIHHIMIGSITVAILGTTSVIAFAYMLYSASEWSARPLELGIAMGTVLLLMLVQLSKRGLHLKGFSLVASVIIPAAAAIAVFFLENELPLYNTHNFIPWAPAYALCLSVMCVLIYQFVKSLLRHLVPL